MTNQTYGINIKGSGGSQAANEFKTVDAAMSKSADTAERVNAASSKQAKATKQLGDEYSRLRESISPTYAAQVKLAQGTDTLNRALAQGVINTKQYKAAQDDLDRSISKSIDNSKSFKNSQDSLSASSAGLITSLRGMAGALALVVAVSSVAGKLDEYTRFNAQLKLTTNSQLEYAQAARTVSSISQIAQADLAAIGTLYARLNTSLKDLNATQGQVASVTETVALGLKVSGATANEQASAILQLSQAFGSGVLRGEEFNAVNEAAPALMRALAASIGVPVGALRNLASDGKITSEVLLKAFGDPVLLDKYRSQAKEVQTISGAVTGLKNVTLEAAGVFDQKTGIAKLFASAIEGVATALQFLIDTAKNEPIDYGKFLPNKGQSLILADFYGGGGIAAKGAIPGYQDRPLVDAKKNSFLPSGASFGANGSTLGGVLPRIDIGNIGEADVAYNKLKATLAGFQEKNPLKDLTSEQDKYNARIKQLAEYEANGILSTQQATRYRIQFQKELSDAIKKTNKEDSDSAKKAAKDQEDYTKARLRYAGDLSAANQKAIDSINRSAAAVEAETLYFGKLPSEITAVTLGKLELAKTNAEVFRDKIAVKNIEDEIEAYKRLGAAQQAAEDAARGRENLERLEKQYKENEKARTDAAKQANDDQAKDFEKTVDGINQVFRLGFAGMLNRGASDWKAWSKSLVTTFKTTVADTVYRLFAQPLVIKVVASLLGLAGINTAKTVADAAGAVGGTTPGVASIGKSLFDGLSGVQGSITKGIEKLGAYLATGNGGLLDTIGGFLGANAGTIGNALPFAGAVLQALTGDIKGAAFTAAGAALGSIIPGVGTVLGGTIGSVIGSFIGGGKKSYANATINSTFANGALSTNSIANNSRGPIATGAVSTINDLSTAFGTRVSALLDAFGQDSSQRFNTNVKFGKNLEASFGFGLANGGSGGVDGYGPKNYGGDAQEGMKRFINDVLTTGLVQAFRASNLSASIKGLFDTVTTTDQIDKMIDATIKLQASQGDLATRFGITVDQSARVAVVTGATGDALIEVINNLSAAATATKKQSEIFIEVRKTLELGVKNLTGQALPTSLEAYDNMLKSIDKSTAEGIDKFAQLFGARATFSEFTASMDTIQKSVRDAVFGLKSPSEQLLELKDNLTASFAKIGLEVPASIQGLIDLSKTIDPTTQAGLDLALAFPDLAEQMKNVQSASDSLVNSLGNISEDSFTSLVNYATYKRVAAVYGVPFADVYTKTLPSFAIGTNYLPTDMQIQAHEGERIIPAADNRELLDRLNDPVLSAEVIAQLELMRSEIKAGNEKLILHTSNTYDVLKKFDVFGLPAEREILA